MQAIVELFNAVLMNAVFPNLPAGKVTELVVKAKSEIDQLTKKDEPCQKDPAS